MANPGNDPFSGSNVRNVLQHILSPKIVSDGTCGYTVKEDLINIDNIYINGNILSSSPPANVVGIGGYSNYYSVDNGLTFKNSTGSTLSGKGVAFNGKRWIAVGTGGTITSIDGIHWTSLGITGYQGFGVSWNGKMWVTVGDGTLGTILYSYDGITWFQANGTKFTDRGYGIAWGNNRWIAVGSDVSGTNKNILTSIDGVNWTAITSGYFQGVSGQYDGIGYSVRYNGIRWVAVGQATSSIVTSTDGLVWTSNNYSMGGSGQSSIVAVEWNGKEWLLGGSISDGSNVVSKSIDGINWTTDNANLSTGLITSITSTGTTWIVSGNNTYAYRDKNSTVWYYPSIAVPALMALESSNVWIDPPISFQDRLQRIENRLFTLNGNLLL